MAKNCCARQQGGNSKTMLYAISTKSEAHFSHVLITYDYTSSPNTIDLQYLLPLITPITIEQFERLRCCNRTEHK